MKNLQYLAAEIFKVKNGFSPIIMNEVFNFQENESYNLRSGINLVMPFQVLLFFPLP